MPTSMPTWVAIARTIGDQPDESLNLPNKSFSDEHSEGGVHGWYAALVASGQIASESVRAAAAKQVAVASNNNRGNHSRLQQSSIAPYHLHGSPFRLQ